MINSFKDEAQGGEGEGGGGRRLRGSISSLLHPNYYAIVCLTVVVAVVDVMYTVLPLTVSVRTSAQF